MSTPLHTGKEVSCFETRRSSHDGSIALPASLGVETIFFPCLQHSLGFSVKVTVNLMQIEVFLTLDNMF